MLNNLDAELGKIKDESEYDGKKPKFFKYPKSIFPNK